MGSYHCVNSRMRYPHCLHDLLDLTQCLPFCFQTGHKQLSPEQKSCPCWMQPPSQFPSLHKLVTLLLPTSFCTASITTIAARGGRLTTNVNMGCNDILDFLTYSILSINVFEEEDRLLFQTCVFAQSLWKQNRTSSLRNMELFYKIKLVDRCNNWHIKLKYMKKVT